MSDQQRQKLKARFARDLREQHPTEAIERAIAADLAAGRPHTTTLRGADLAAVFARVAYFVVNSQRLGGRDLGLVPELTRMAVSVRDAEIHVDSAFRLHAPVHADLGFRYTLVNGQDGRLDLKDDRVKVSQRTGRLDMMARAGLAAMGVEARATHELRDVAEVIRKTLPAQLAAAGYAGAVCCVALHITPDDGLRVELAAG